MFAFGCVFAPPCIELAGTPGVEPGSMVPQTNMLSITPCPNGWELAEVPGFEPGSRGPKPLMLSATPYLHAVPWETAVALRECNADQPNAVDFSSTAFPEGLLFHISS